MVQLNVLEFSFLYRQVYATCAKINRMNPMNSCWFILGIFVTVFCYLFQAFLLKCFVIYFRHSLSVCQGLSVLQGRSILGCMSSLWRINVATRTSAQGSWNLPWYCWQWICLSAVVSPNWQSTTFSQSTLLCRFHADRRISTGTNT